MFLLKIAVICTVVLSVTVSAYVEELDDTFLETKQPEDRWLIMFHAPWCEFCRKLDPVWHDIGSELRSLGSPVNVGICDGSKNTALTRQYQVRLYPTILMLKDGVQYNYRGARTKDSIMVFADRITGPIVRTLNSPQLFQNVMRRHDVLIVYIGASSPLKGNYTSLASELIVDTSFFSASRDVLPKSVSIAKLPTVAIFKDGTYYTYNEEQNGDLRSWINQERFPGFFKIDSYTLYYMGETGKLVALALVDERRPSQESIRYKHVLETVATDYRELYSRDFHFGFMEGNEYVNGLVMGEVSMPCIIVLNLSNDGYFLPPEDVANQEQLLSFLNGVLNNTVKCQGGNGAAQRVKRLYKGFTETITSMIETAPATTAFLFSIPSGIVILLVRVCVRMWRSSREEEKPSSPSPSSPSPSPSPSSSSSSSSPPKSSRTNRGQQLHNKRAAGKKAD